MVRKPEISAGLMGHLAHMQTLPLLFITKVLVILWCYAPGFQVFSEAAFLQSLVFLTGAGFLRLLWFFCRPRDDD